MSRTIDLPEPPEGFVLQSNRGPFTRHNGPFYLRPNSEGLEQAFFAIERHCNGLGLVHGGMLTAFLDGLLAGAVGRALEATPVTIHLSVDFLAMGRAGEWIIGRARLTRATKHIAFSEGQAMVGERVLARATGVFSLMRRHGG